MALKIRLRQQGRRNQTVYRLVLSDVRYPRDGKYMEMLGWYDPQLVENNVKVDAERVTHWLNHGATLTEKAASLVKKVAPEVLAEYNRKIVRAREKARLKKKAARSKKKEIVAA